MTRLVRVALCAAVAALCCMGTCEASFLQPHKSPVLATAALTEIQAPTPLATSLALRGGGKVPIHKVVTRIIVRRAARRVFKMVDADHSGSIAQSELYAAVLLFYLKINHFVKAIEPSRDEVAALLEEFDTDNSKSLNFEEFFDLSHMLLGNLGMRMLVQTILVMVICPVFSLWLIHRLKDSFVSKLLCGIAPGPLGRICNLSDSAMAVMLTGAQGGVIVPKILHLLEKTGSKFRASAAKSLATKKAREQAKA